MNETFYHILPNGIRIVHRPTQSPVVYAGLMTGVGTRHERPEENGMAHYIEHCVFKGTEHYTARQIINKIEGIGGEINAYTTKEETTFYAAALKQHFRTTLHLLADMILHPTFPKRETDKELTVILDEIESYNDSPSDLIYDDFESLLFHGSSLALPILGTKKTLRRISTSPEQPLQWMANHYSPERMVLFVTGDISPKQMVAHAERELGHFTQMQPIDNQTVQSHNMIHGGDADSAPQYVSYRRHTHQTHLMFGARAYEIGNEKQLAMYLLNNILGGGSMSSRLNLSLREQRGLVYTVESQYTPLSDTGYWNVYMACEPPHKDACMELAMNELQRLRDTRLTSAQFQHAIRQLEGQMAISAENQENNALAMGKQMLYHNVAPTWQETFQRICELTPADLQEVAQEVYENSNIHVLQYD